MTSKAERIRRMNATGNETISNIVHTSGLRRDTIPHNKRRKGIEYTMNSEKYRCCTHRDRIYTNQQ
jgi:hypothetical protein